MPKADDDFPLRLYLLAQGELSPGPVSEWLLVWFYRDHEPSSLALAHHASPQRRALAVQRHHPRARHSLVDCLEGARRADHPQLRLVWLLHATQHQAVSDLLRELADPALPDDLVDALTWALGQYGREIVIPIGDRFAAALPTIKDRYCRALWYLGAEARGCERSFHNHDTAWSRAVLYRLEGWGARKLLDWQAAPLWLDQQTLLALAEKAFSLNPDERWYCLDALSGWGPQLEQAGDLLEALTLDTDPCFGQAALLTMGQLGLSPKPSTLRALLMRKDMDTDKLCEHIRPEDLQNDPELAVRILQSTTRQHTIQSLLEIGSVAEVRRAALQAFARNGGDLEELVRYLRDPDLREAAAQLLVKSASPDTLLKLLDQRRIRQEIRRSRKLLFALVFWEPEQFEELRLQLATLDPALLEDLEFESIQWSNYANFNQTQRQVAHALIELHQRFPEQLLKEMMFGLVEGSEPVQLLVQYAPRDQLAGWLAQIGARREPSQRHVCWRALHDLQKEGWLALVSQLGHPKVLVAQAALRQLIDWHSAVDWLVDSALHILKIPVHPIVFSQLGEWLATTLFPPQTKVTEAHDDLALVLLPLAGENRRFLESYLYRSRPYERLLQLYPDYPPPIRLRILQWLRIWRPVGIRTRVRGLKIDKEPRLRLERLQLLHDLGGLSPEEIDHLKALVRDHLSSAGRQPELPETPDQLNRKGDL